MKESLKKIIKTIILISIIIIITYMSYTKFFKSLFDIKINKSVGISSRQIDINITNNKIICEDIINFNLNNKKEIYYYFFQDYDYISDIKAYINNDEEINLKDVKIGLSNGIIYLNNNSLNTLKVVNNNVPIRLVYEIDMDYIARYKNIDVILYYIDFRNIGYLNNLTINLNSNSTITNLTVDNAIIIQNNNGYSIKFDNIERNTDVNILFKINKQLNNTINSDYMEKQILNENEFYSYIDERKDILIIVIIISIVLLIISLIINYDKKTTNYRRETEELVSPILAEAIVDGKIGLKELIMTTIIELSIKGNIEIINNDTLKLVSYNNLEKYESNIVTLLFKNRIMKFSDINNIFANSNSETSLFNFRLSLVKESLLKKIYSMNIFSKRLNLLNKIIGLCSILISINILQILLSDVGLYYMKYLFMIINFSIIFYYINSIKNNKSMKEEVLKNNGYMNKISIMKIISVIFIIFVLVFTGINVAKYHIVFFITTIFIILLNMYISFKSKKIILTKKGKEERIKLLELKNYINDYSLIKNRDLKSVIIWDKYLAYATAFGIPNKITNTIYESWHNINMNLQVIIEILS